MFGSNHLNAYVCDIVQTEKNHQLSPQISNFADEIQNVNPKLKIMATGATGSRAYVYVPGEVLVRGVIGYSYQNVELKYCVASRNISNKQYSEGNNYYHVKASKNINAALKNARAYLTRAEITDVLESSYGLFANAHSNIRSSLTSTRHSKIARVDALLSKTENFNQLRDTIKGRETELSHEITALADLNEQLYKNQNEKNSLSLVTVQEQHGQVVCEVRPLNYQALAFHPSGYSYKCLLDHRMYDSVNYQQDTLPESFADKLAVLNITENKELIAGVGMKINPQVFYVYDFPEEVNHV